MNKDRRKRIYDILSFIEEQKLLLESLLEEEQEAYDNIPESLQDGEKGEKMNTGIENIESAISSLEEMNEYLTEAIE